MTDPSVSLSEDIFAVRCVEKEKNLAVSPAEVGLRFDRFLSFHFPEYTRSFLGKLIVAGAAQINDRKVKVGYRLQITDHVSIQFPALQQEKLTPEHIDFPVLFEDEHILVLSKPPGLVVHPACGHQTGTLASGLLYHCRQLPAAAAERPGIVHRLDKDTSGVMLVAKTEQALCQLMADFKNRTIHKTYHAILLRCPRERRGRIAEPIGRHPVDRKKMAIRLDNGRHAATNWRIVEEFANHWCFAEIGIETGRTHQIRVHMASLKAPVVGDSLYGGSAAFSADPQLTPKRQMLHASTLQFHHPVSGEEMQCTAPLWPDMQQLLEALRQL